MYSVFLVIGLSVLGGLWRLGIWIYKRRRANAAEKDLHPFFSPQDISKATEYYVPTKFQSNPPSNYHELQESNRVIAREKLIPFFINKGFKPEKNDAQRFYMILAGSGMGKTTFMLNLYLSYLRQKQLGRAKYNIKLLPLGAPKLLQHIDEIEDPRNTILLLDGLDEDNQAVRTYKKRLNRIINKVQEFRVVVFTCRTQFFPSEDAEPRETTIKWYGGRQGFITFFKMYLAPFDEKDISIYLSKRFGPFSKKKKERATQIVSKSPSLMVRPMILSYIEDLLEEDVVYEYVTNLYRMVIKKWIQREADRVGPDRRESFKDELYRFSQEVALNIYSNRRNRNGLFMTEREIRTFAENHEIKLEEIEIKSRSLLNRNMTGQYKFAHKSILEYFLAVECRDNSKFFERMDFEGLGQARAFYNELIFLKNTIPFIQGLDGRAKAKLDNGEAKSFAQMDSADIASIRSLEFHELDELNVISPLTSLRELDVSHTKVKDFKSLIGLDELRRLVLTQTGIQDLSVLQAMHMLEDLNLDHCLVRNLQPLRHLDRLRRLSLSHSLVESLSQLGALIYLSQLHINHTKIKDLEPLKKLKELEVLSMDGCQISSLNPIRELHGLTKLSILHCKVKNLNPLKNMQGLKELHVAHNPIGNFKVLKDLKKLKKLTLSKDQIGEGGLDTIQKMLPGCKIILQDS